MLFSVYDHFVKREPMLKKIIVFMLCLSFALALFPHAEQSGEGLRYAADFDDNERPRGSDVTFGQDGNIYAEDGALHIEASGTYPPVTTILFPYSTEPGDGFVYGCDITFESAMSDNCWAALCFNAQSDEILYQLTVKSRVTDADSVALQYKCGPSSWKDLGAAPLSDYIGENGISAAKFSGGRIAEGASLHLSVAAGGGVVFGYIDGVAVIECRIPERSCGYVGLCGRGVVFSADNVTVGSQLPYELSAADSFGASVYQPVTGIAAPPVVICRDRLNSALPSASEKRAAAVMMTVRESGGELHGYDGAVDLGTLEYRLGICAGIQLPVLCVSEQSSAEQLNAYMRENRINDAFVVVSRPALASCFSSNKYIRVAADMTSYGSAGAAEIYKSLYSNGVRTVILSEEAADADTVYELHKRFISVWVNCTSGAVSGFEAALNGADAVITAEPIELLSLFEKTENRTVLRRPVVISDGGDSVSAPAHTYKAVASAVRSGASVIKTHVKITKDKKAVISGTDVTYGMTAEAVIAETALSALKTLSYTDGRMAPEDRIMTLEELFESVYGIKNGPVLLLEADDAGSVEIIVSAAKEYEMEGRCVVTGGSRGALSAAQKAGWAVLCTDVPDVWDGENGGGALSSVCRLLGSYASALCTNETAAPEGFLGLLHSRGVPVYLDNAASSVSSGYDGFTSSVPSSYAKLPAELKASQDRDGRLSAKICYYDGTELDVTALCTIVVIEGGVNLLGGVVTGSGRYTVVCPQTAENGEKYNICSHIISASAAAADTETEEDGQSGSENTAAVVIIIVSSAAAAGGLILLGILAGKKRREDQKP